MGGGASVTVLLPAGSIQLLGHIVVRAGKSVTLQADAAGQTSLTLHQWQLQVEVGGKLELLGLGVVDAIGSSAILTYGEVIATNCTFSHCVAGPNSVLRYAEGVSAEGSDEHPPVRGLYLSANGGVVLVALSAAKFTAGSCAFFGNSVRDARLGASGGAIFAMGGSVVLRLGTVVRDNAAIGGAMVARAGAINCIFADMDLSDVIFVGNEAVGGDAVDGPGGTTMHSPSVRAGAIDMSTCRVTISSSTFKQNNARDASVRAAGGALAVGEGSVLEVRRCLLDRNEALRGAQLTFGGAVKVDALGFARFVDTTFDGNAARSFTEGFGGAIMSEGSIVLEGGVVFSANVVSGDVKAAGGAIAICQATAGFNSTSHPGPVFVGNMVRRCPCALNSPRALISLSHRGAKSRVNSSVPWRVSQL
jgi:hypothetical protein